MRVLFSLLGALNALAMLASTASAGTYPQLISTRYADAKGLPADFAKPVPKFDFVDTSKLPEGSQVLSAAKSASGSIWVVTDKGAFRFAPGKNENKYVPFDLGPQRSEPAQAKAESAAEQLVEVAADKQGHIWAATQSGVFVTDGEKWWQSLSRNDGVPIERLNCLHIAANGDVWGGSQEGAWRLRDGAFRYFWGKRWLPGNIVRAVWTDNKGRAWLDTDGGVACIEERPMTLAEKAAHFDEITQKRHMRRGFINEIHLKTPGDVDGEFRWEISDNDGLWNAIYVGAMVFRYAATKDPAARKQAKVALDAMFELERLTGISGYPARAVVTDDEVARGVDGVNLNEKVRVQGETDKIWFRSPVDPKVWCKGDTSSDEMDGHYFAWYVYHELVADDAEKKQIAAIVRRCTDHILEHNLTLVGHTGRKTRWGVWGPQFLNDDPFWRGARPLNSLEILAYLKIAEHITGDVKYTKAYSDLIDKHHYLLNTLLIRRGREGHWSRINHSDDEMLYMMYYAILQLERDPDRRRILLQSIARTWESAPEEQGIRNERSPLYDFMYGALTGKPCDFETGIETLQDWPWEMIEWRVNNRQRQDVQMKAPAGPGRNTQRGGEYERVLPSSERRLARWNSNPFAADGGNDGRTEDDGAAWALAYWLGVYHGFVAK